MVFWGCCILQEVGLLIFKLPFGKLTQLVNKTYWQLIYLLMVIFHSYVNVYQRVNLIKSHETTIFLWFSHFHCAKKNKPSCCSSWPINLQVFDSLVLSDAAQLQTLGLTFPKVGFSWVPFGKRLQNYGKLLVLYLLRKLTNFLWP